MAGLLLAALSLLVSVASSTFEYPKDSENYPPSSRPIVAGIAPLQGVSDQRMTHWDSRSNSNLADDRAEDDRDEGRGRISYPSLVDEQRQPLVFPRITERSLQLSEEINRILAENSGEDQRMFRDCVPAKRDSLFLVASGDDKGNLERVRNLPRSQPEVFGTLRCRRWFNAWNFQHPLYVEEPGWIVVNLDAQPGQGSAIREQDPFYVARGKRSSKFSEANRGDSEDIETASLDSTLAPGANLQKGIARIKRQSFNDAKSRSFIDGGEDLNTSGFTKSKGRTSGYVQLRDKHSDILDILNEPFFISRGKKSSLKLGLYRMNNRYSKALEDFESRKRVLDGYFARASRSETANNSNRGPRPLVESSPYRDRRGFMEELLREADPFYVARGKRSMPNSLRAYDDNFADQSVSTIADTLSSVETSTDNSSVRVEH